MIPGRFNYIEICQELRYYNVKAPDWVELTGLDSRQEHGSRTFLSTTSKQAHEVQWVLGAFSQG